MPPMKLLHAHAPAGPPWDTIRSLFNREVHLRADTQGAAYVLPLDPGASFSS